MDRLAKKALVTLLRLADRHSAGVATRAAALTPRHLKEYSQLRSLQNKEGFEAVLKYAQDSGAVRLTWPAHQPDGYIQRVELVDVEALARLLGQDSLTSRLAIAQGVLQGRVAAFPVLQNVLDQWASIKKVRNTSPDDAGDWLDACVAIESCRNAIAVGQLETAVRDASARVFRNSKRIEALIAPIDVLLSGNLEEAARSEAEILQELGLIREEQPARLAGNVVVRRERGAFALDRPYCGLAPSTVLGLSGAPSLVLSIENLTTFHVQARQRCDADELLLYTAGMPSPKWRQMYVRVLRGLPSGGRVAHWGDFDEGGFRIAAFLAGAAAEAGVALAPWCMHPDDIPLAQRRRATDRTVERMAYFAEKARWLELAAAIRNARFVSEQEG
jgi:hypothetical protein